jgi:hypothetical protein
MLFLHDQSRGPWILLHVVSGPWTSFVAALDKGQCRKAVCRRHKGVKQAIYPEYRSATQHKISWKTLIF